MLVMSIPTNIILTGSQTLSNFHVNGSVDITPMTDSVDTISTEIKFCNKRQKEDSTNFKVKCLQFTDSFTERKTEKEGRRVNYLV